MNEEMELHPMDTEDVFGVFCRAAEHFARTELGLKPGSDEEKQAVRKLASLQLLGMQLGFVERHRDADGNVTCIGDMVEIDGRLGKVLGYTDDGFVMDFDGTIESVDVYGEEG